MNLLKIIIILTIIHITAYAEVINVDNIIDQAKKQNKQLLVFFHMTYCGACKRMIRDSINNPKIIKQIEKDFIYLDMNINNSKDVIIYKEFKGSVHQFARTFDIYLYPSTIFIGSDCEVKYHLKGYRDTEKFSTVIEYVSTRSYEKMDFDSFIDEKEFNK